MKYSNFTLASRNWCFFITRKDDKNGNQIEDRDKAETEGYAYDGWKVFVSKITGIVITIESSKRKKIKNESKVG